MSVSPSAFKEVTISHKGTIITQNRVPVTGNQLADNARSQQSDRKTQSLFGSIFSELGTDLKNIGSAFFRGPENLLQTASTSVFSSVGVGKTTPSNLQGQPVVDLENKNAEQKNKDAEQNRKGLSSLLTAFEGFEIKPNSGEASRSDSPKEWVSTNRIKDLETAVNLLMKESVKRGEFEKFRQKAVTKKGLSDTLAEYHSRERIEELGFVTKEEIAAKMYIRQFPSQEFEDDKGINLQRGSNQSTPSNIVPLNQTSSNVTPTLGKGLSPFETLSRQSSEGENRESKKLKRQEDKGEGDYILKI